MHSLQVVIGYRVRVAGWQKNVQHLLPLRFRILWQLRASVSAATISHLERKRTMTSILLVLS